MRNIFVLIIIIMYVGFNGEYQRQHQGNTAAACIAVCHKFIMPTCTQIHAIHVYMGQYYNYFCYPNHYYNIYVSVHALHIILLFNVYVHVFLL